MLKELISGAFVLCNIFCFTIAAPVVDRTEEQNLRQTQVVILGGGIAGITAAQTLHEQGVDDFIIVEYNGEIGGRNHHTNFGSQADGSPYVVELGSNWAQERSKNNPVWQLVQKYNIAWTHQNYNSFLSYNETGLVDTDDLYKEFGRATRRFMAQADDIIDNNRFDQSERAGLTDAGWFPVTNSAAQVVEWFTFDFDNGAPPEYASQIFGTAAIPGSTAPSDVNGVNDNYVHDQRGFNYIIRREAETFLKPNDPRLLLNTIVTDIEYNSKGVTIRTKNGTSIHASHAICTFSLGVLQASVARQRNSDGNGKAVQEDGLVTFSPELPAWKRRGISNFGMATYTKVFMQFASVEKFWPQGKQFATWADPTTRGNFPVWQSLSLPNFLPGSGIIFGTVVTPNSAQIEAQSDEETKAQCLKILRTMFGEKNVPEPTAFLYPRWGRTPWARGSYSYWPVGTTLQQHENLRGTVGGRLWFAGEHTSAEDYGYLHGAWFEGRAAGLRVAGCVQQGEGSSKCVQETSYGILHDTNGRADSYNRSNGIGVADLRNPLEQQYS